MKKWEDEYKGHVELERWRNRGDGEWRRQRMEEIDIKMVEDRKDRERQRSRQGGDASYNSGVIYKTGNNVREQD